MLFPIGPGVDLPIQQSMTGFNFHMPKNGDAKDLLLKMSEVYQLAPLNASVEMVVLERPLAKTLSKVLLKLKPFKCLKHLHITHLHLNCLGLV